MIDPAAVLNNLAAQAPLLAIALVALHYSLDKKIEKLDARIERMEGSISELRRELRTFADAVVGFQETLIEFLEVKGVATKSETRF
ncbi:MAG: hypothetical protein QXP31_07650 [Pyrobaculum sp.]